MQIQRQLTPKYNFRLEQPTKGSMSLQIHHCLLPLDRSITSDLHTPIPIVPIIKRYVPIAKIERGRYMSNKYHIASATKAHVIPGATGRDSIPISIDRKTLSYGALPIL